MSLLSVRSGRLRLASAVLAVALCLMLFGCVKTAETAWEPTKDDTAGIKAAVEAKEAYFRTGLAELAMQMCDTAIAGTTLSIYTRDLRNNRFIGRFRLDAMEHVLDSHELKYTFIAGLDTLSQETTCTVTMAETIPGTLKMHAWEKTVYLRDSLFFPSPGETLRLPFYTDTMTRCDDTIRKPIFGASVDGCVLKKVNGKWDLWKIAGGGRFYAPGPADAPYIFYCYLTSANRVDTVNFRPDTLHYGIQRFFSVDTADHEMLTYAVGDWVKVSNLTTNQEIAFDYLYFNGRRYEFDETVKFDSTLTRGEIYRLSLEHIPATVLWEVDDVTSPYTATVWGIPIRIQ